MSLAYLDFRTALTRRGHAEIAFDHADRGRTIVVVGAFAKESLA